MCKLCERDMNFIIKIEDVKQEDFIAVKPDRLAVLEKDHLAMERLRTGKINFGIRFRMADNGNDKFTKRHWGVEPSEHYKLPISNDPADAILGVKEEK